MQLPNALLSAITNERTDEGTPEVTDIHFDLWTLRITLIFPSSNNPTYVEFCDSEGFRVLDEGDLTEFWDSNGAPSWLCSVKRGGWLDLECSRPGGDVLATKKDLREYLVVGINDCVSVIAYEPPSIKTTAH